MDRVILLYLRATSTARTAFDGGDGEDGASMVEYVLLITLIAMVAFIAVQLVGQALGERYDSIAASVADA